MSIDSEAEQKVYFNVNQEKSKTKTVFEKGNNRSGTDKTHDNMASQIHLTYINSFYRRKM
jgi:hypothetical protein